MKSYGRAPTFLLATGYGQVRSVVAALAGDQAAAIPGDQGPPTAAMCATNRELLAADHRGHQPVPAVTGLPSGAAPIGTATDWSAASCCPTP
jgi:hypothetical protein